MNWVYMNQQSVRGNEELIHYLLFPWCESRYFQKTQWIVLSICMNEMANVLREFKRW